MRPFANKFTGLRKQIGIGSSRHYYQATAEFICWGPNGKLEKRKVPIKIGDPQNTYVMIPPDIGHALQASTLLGHTTPAQVKDRSKLIFYHETQHFAHGNDPFPLTRSQ